jgi:hypothetical protein
VGHDDGDCSRWQRRQTTLSRWSRRPPPRPADDGTAIGFCPSDFPVAVSGFSNVRPLKTVGRRFGARVGTAESTGFLLDIPMAAPSSHRLAGEASNLEVVSRNLVGTTIAARFRERRRSCTDQRTAGAFGYKTFKIFAPVPDGWTVSARFRAEKPRVLVRGTHGADA